MKVTVTFGDTAVVVPCKAGWTVRDLTDQATRRYRRILDQYEESEVRTNHLEYLEGGILDMDDLLSDLVEDRDKLVAVFDTHRAGSDSPRETMSNGYSSSVPSPEPLAYYPHLQYQERGEIEVNEASLKTNTPLLVRSSSDSALALPHEIRATPSPDYQNNTSPEPEINNVLKGALDRLHSDEPAAKMSQVNFSTLTRAVEFPGDWGPLGIHVIPYCSSLSGRTLGLHIKGIEENSRSKRENIFQQDECIVQINNTPLQDKTFAQSQEVFRQAMTTPTVRLEVLPLANKPRYEKSLIGQLFTGDGKDIPAQVKSPILIRAKADSQPEPKANTKLEVRRPDPRAKTPEPAAVNPSPAELQPGHGSLERVSPALPGRAASSSPTPRNRSQSPLDSRSPVPGLGNLTNRKGGKKIKIDLKKGAEGLGFTVVTRDSSVHGPGPILVKNILPRGAAVKDGRLQPGDRILEVNGVDMTGRSQEELVAMLRSTRQGESVYVVVARQEDIFLPRELKGEEAGSLVLEDGREQLMYEIALNESGSAGLGVSLKGNKSRETGEDLGIFIKSIIHGGAAYKDGRLTVNDQMIAVNGESLLGRSNHAAMETLRRSMSSEGNARGTIQLVVLRVPRQMSSANAAPAANGSTSHLSSNHTSSSNQELRGHNAYQGPSGPSRNPEPAVNGASHAPMMTNNYTYGNSGSAPYPAATANGGHGHYSNNDEELEDSFPPPPSPGAVEEMNRDLPPTPTRHSEFQKQPHMAAAFYTDSQLANDKDNIPRNRASKSMDLVADESNMGSLVGQRNEPSAGGALGPTLGLWKSSSLESLQTAVSEAKQSRSQAQVPFHRPRPHMVRGRGCNQSFRIAIDKSYDGPSEDDDDLSEHSSGHETPASSSSRHGLDVDDGKKKKKTKGKKNKKNKTKKKTDDSVDDPEKKTKKKGFGLLRFGKKKDDKSKDAAKGSKSKLDALSEEELDRIPDQRDSYEPRYAEIHSGHATPDHASFPDVEDDDSDPNYARINNFRQPPSPLSFISRTPSPGALQGGQNQLRASSEDLDGLYAKVNKTRPPPAQQNQHQTQADSDPRLQGLRREYQQPRAAPGYDELDAARRRVLDHDPHRVAPRGAESRPAHRYEEIDRQYPTQPRRDPYDYPTHSRPVPREPAPYQGPSGRAPPPQTGHQAPSNQRYHPSSPRTGQPHRAAVRQDVPPSPAAGRRGRHYYEAAGGRVDNYRQASPGRYTSPDRYGYGDDREPDPRRKNPLIGAV
ncbi:par-3 family cell polarity regulator beta a [Centropristis striata]|uniref:par-3 family cell polarity regulator beta a n=1 Tax=Centropristis striata TaxID=184440 RepID=UPI0027DF5039|nr:par-3 family cell polarity regulator beta a [Centropristis striata]